MFAKIVEYMESDILKRMRVPCCDLIVMRDHQQLFRHTCGLRSVTENIPLDKNALFYLYSCTKPITVTAALRLVEEGKLSLDAPVSDYLPAYHTLFVLENGILRPARKPLTIRHLFTMTGGFDYRMRPPETKALLDADPLAGTLDVVNIFAAKPLCFEPGTRFQYSICHDILAAVVETVAGKRFSSYLHEILFDPLGMMDITFSPTDGERCKLVEQFDYRNGAVQLTKQTNTFQVTPQYESGGAGLISSLADYAKFADVLACGGTAANGYRFLAPETIALLRTEQLRSFAIDSSFSCVAGPGYGYGLGVRTRISPEGGRSPVGEFGWDGAGGCYLLVDNTHRLSIVFGMQVLDWPDCIGNAHSVIRDMVYDILGI